MNSLERNKQISNLKNRIDKLRKTGVLLRWTSGKEMEVEARKEVNTLIRNLRKEYKQNGQVFDFVHITETGLKTIHSIIVNNEVLGKKVFLDFIQNNSKCIQLGCCSLDKMEDSLYQSLANFLLKDISQLKPNENVRFRSSRNLVDTRYKSLSKISRWENWKKSMQ